MVAMAEPATVDLTQLDAFHALLALAIVLTLTRALVTCTLPIRNRRSSRFARS